MKTEMAYNGRKYVPIFEFGPIANNPDLCEDFKVMLMYILRMFGPDHFFNFMFEYKSRS